MNMSALGQIALPVSNVEASQAFYQKKLGVKFLYRYADLAFFDCAGVRLMLEGSPKKRVGPTGVCLYFKVTDIKATHAALKKKGVLFEDEPHLIAKMPDHELWMAFLKDPDGHLLAIMEEKRA